MARSKIAVAEHAFRLESLCCELEKAGVGGAVLDNRDDQFYFTGYTGSDAMLVIAVARRRTWIVTDPRYTEEVERSAPNAEAEMWQGGMARYCGGMLRRLRVSGAAYTPSSLTAAASMDMRDEARTVRTWHDAGAIIAGLRAVKSPAEVKRMRAALACAEAAFLRSKARWKSGMTELDIKNDLDMEMRRGGARDAAFETIVAVGANASLPHAHAGGGKVRAGKMVLIDFGASVDRYNSDLTRTLWAGSVPSAWRRRYEAVLEAQAAGIAAVGPGEPGRTPHMAAVEVFVRRDVAKHFTHGLGHGVGLAVHEEPRLGRLGGEPLRPGNVVTVEPGLYFPGQGGIRVEDMVLVTAKGREILSSLPKALDDMVF